MQNEVQTIGNFHYFQYLNKELECKIKLWKIIGLAANLSLSNELAGIIPCNHSFQSFMNNWRQDPFIKILTKGSINCR